MFKESVINMHWFLLLWWEKICMICDVYNYVVSNLHWWYLKWKVKNQLNIHCIVIKLGNVPIQTERALIELFLKCAVIIWLNPDVHWWIKNIKTLIGKHCLIEYKHHFSQWTNALNGCRYIFQTIITNK